VNDWLRELGPLALPSRLRRLSDRLHRDTSRLYRELGLDMEARWFPVVALLAEGKPASVTEIAVRVGMTHPAVHQIVHAMSEAGLVHSEPDRADQRRRLLSLSAKGHAVVAQLQPLWQCIRTEMSTLLAESSGELMTSLAAFEQQLERREFYERVAEGSKPRMRSESA
jgi:DNA-binding MarR family transcriptional regulator